MVLRYRLCSSTNNASVQPLSQCTRMVVTQSPTTQACRRVVLTVYRRLTISTLSVVNCVRVIRHQRIMVMLRVRRVNSVLTSTVTRKIIKARRAINVQCHPSVLIRRLLNVRSQASLRRVRVTNLINVSVTNGLGLRQSTRHLKATLRQRLRRFQRKCRVILRRSNGNSRLTTNFVRAIISSLVMEIRNENSMIRALIFCHVLRARLRSVRSIVRLRIVTRILNIRDVRLNLNVTRHRLHLKDLRRLVQVVQASTRNLATVRSVLARSRNGANGALLYLLVTSEVVIRQARRTARHEVVTNTMILTRRLLRSCHRLLLISSVTNNNRMYLKVTVRRQNVRTLSNTNRRLRRLVLVHGVECRVNKVSANRELVINVLRRQAKASNSEALHYLRRNRRINCRQVKRLHVRRILRSFVVTNVTRDCQVRVITRRRLIRSVNARRRNLQGLRNNVLVLIRLEVTLSSIIRRN